MEDEEDGDSAGSSTPVAYGPDDRLVIPFQNENLYACLEKPDGSSKVRRPRRTSWTQANVRHPQILVTVPDLITVLDSQNGAALGTPD